MQNYTFSPCIFWGFRGSDVGSPGLLGCEAV